MAEMIQFVKSLTVGVNRLTASVNKLTPRRRLRWLTRMEATWLAVCAGALLVQGANLAYSVVMASGWATAWVMVVFRWQYQALAYLAQTIWHARADDRLVCRLHDCLGEVFAADGAAASGTVDGMTEPIALSYWTSEHWAIMRMVAVGRWTMVLATPVGQPCVIENGALLTVMASWQVDPAAAVVTAQLLCRPAKVLWLESAEVVW